MPKSTQIFAFFGTDEARAKEEAVKLSRKLTPEANAEFGLEIINGSAETSEHASRIIADTMDAIQTLPFLGGDKTVWLQNANIFADSVTGRAAATQQGIERLTALLNAGLPPGVSLIISGSSVDKRRAFFKKLKSLGEVTVYDLPDPSRPGWEREVMSLAKKQAHALGFGLEPDALEHFVMSTGENTRQLNEELQKLGLYLGEKKLAAVDDVRAVVSTTRAGVIFEIGDAIAERNLPRAIELIDHQLRRGENAIGILLAAIVPKVRSLLIACDLKQNYNVSGRDYRGYESKLKSLPESATAHLPRKNDGGISAYPIFLASKTCGRFTPEELARGLRLCLEANRRLVTTQLDSKIVLSQLVTQLLSKKQRSAA